MSVTYLRQPDVAELLGATERTIKALVARRAIPHRKLPGVKAVLFPAVELHGWIDDPLTPLQIEVGNDGARAVRYVGTQR
jgi:excisionase family DNA binding protein